MPEPGQKIDSDLRLLRLLGEGGMGRVWVARHLTLDIDVAVKFLNPELVQDEQWLERFRREAQSIAKIDSAHVVRVFDHGITEDREPFIVMELLRGDDLGKRLENLRQLAVDEVALIVTQVCRALSRVHDLGIVHRDVKPENIFLTHEGTDLFVKMLDFGIAKRPATEDPTVTDSRTMIGTPYYMSPEQVMSARHVDHRADLWALAVVTYQMLTGRRPFVGETLGAIHVKINAGKFDSPASLRPELPVAIDAWFARAFHRDIERRFRTAREFSDTFCLAVGVLPSVLQRFVPTPTGARESRGVTKTVIASVQTIARQRPAPRTVGVAGLGLVLLVGVGIWAWIRPLDAKAPRSFPTTMPVVAPTLERTVGSSDGAFADRTSALPHSLPPRAFSPSAMAPAASSSAHLSAGTVKRPSVPHGVPSHPSAAPSGSARPIKDRGF
jgi:serine/threonine protein kinase